MVADGGSFGAVDLTASGVNKVYLKGDMSSVTVHLSGEGHSMTVFGAIEASGQLEHKQGWVRLSSDPSLGP